MKSKIEGTSCIPKQIKRILDLNNNPRDCTSRYGQAVQKRTDPLEGFSFINHENKFSIIFDFVFSGTVSKTGQKYELLCFKYRRKFGFGNGIEFYCVFIQETCSNSQYSLLFATYKIPLLLQQIQKLVKMEIFLIKWYLNWFYCLSFFTIRPLIRTKVIHSSWVHLKDRNTMIQPSQSPKTTKLLSMMRAPND